MGRDPGIYVLGFMFYVMYCYIYSMLYIMYCYILYIDQWRFRYIMLQNIANGVPKPRDALVRHVLCCGFDNLTTFFLTLKTM